MGSRVPSSFQPIRFFATLAPIATPTPADPWPPAPAPETPTTVAPMWDTFSAFNSTLCSLTSRLSFAYAFVLPPMMFSATAPPPAKETAFLSVLPLTATAAAIDVD